MVRPEPNLEVDYKEKYKTLKSKLKCLIYENEYFQQSLKTHQRKFLKATRDRNFLLDRLAKYEPPEHSSTDSDETESSDDENMRQIKRGKYEPSGRAVSMTPPPDTSKTNALMKPKRKKAKAFLMATSADTVTANMVTDHTMPPEIEHVIVSDMNSVNSDKEGATEVTEEIISEDIPIDG